MRTLTTLGIAHDSLREWSFKMAFASDFIMAVLLVKQLFVECCNPNLTRPADTFLGPTMPGVSGAKRRDSLANSHVAKTKEGEALAHFA
jgi:hypothetical protein